MPLDLSRVSFARYARTSIATRTAAKLDPAYLQTLEQTAPVVQDFAEWLVRQGSLRDHQIFFVGRSMDLPYHATVAIAQQQRRDCWIRPEDVFLIDYSFMKFKGGFPQWKQHDRIRQYLEDCGLNLQRPLAIVDDIYLNGTTVEELRNVLRSKKGYPQSVVMYDDDPMREDGARPTLAYARRRPAPEHWIRSAAVFLSNHDSPIPAFDAGVTRSTVLAMSRHHEFRNVGVYDPARSYRVEIEGDTVRPAYQRMDFAHWARVREVFLRMCAS